MDGLTSFLDTRASFEATLLVTTWVGMALLTVMVASLLIRLRRVELARVEATPERDAPYNHVRGRHASEVLPATALAQRPELLIFLSSHCRACASIIAELAELRTAPRAGLVWLDGAPAELPSLPPGPFVVPDGAGVARQLGIHVTPFVLELDAAGMIVDGRPVNRLSALAFVANGSLAHQAA